MHELLFMAEGKEISPSALVRRLQSEDCPTEQVLRALFNRHPLVRKTALQVTTETCLGSKFATLALKSMMVLLTVESEESILLHLLSTIALFLKHESHPQFITYLQLALASQNAIKQNVQDVIERDDMDHVFHDLADNNSWRVRSAVTDVMRSIVLALTQFPSDRADFSSTSQNIACGCFTILEYLLQDPVFSVRLASVTALRAIFDNDSKGTVVRLLKINEKTVKALLRMVSVDSHSKRSPTFSLTSLEILELLRCYPCATVTAYGYVDACLRSLLYSAQSEAVDRGESRDVAKICNLFQDIALKNWHFAKVLDLVRPVSDKVTPRLIDENTSNMKKR